MALNAALRISKNTAALLLGTVCRMAFTFVFVLFIAADLGVEGFGKYSVVLHFFELFLSLTASSVATFVTREVARRPRHLSQHFSTSCVLLGVLTLLSAAVLALLCRVFGYAADTTQAIYIASLALLPASVSVVLEAIFVSLERAEFVTFGTAIETLLRILLSCGALLAGFGLLTLFWVLVLTRCCLLAYYWFSLQRLTRVEWRYRWPHMNRFLRRWRVYAIENCLATTFYNMDVIILSVLSGEAAVGLYTAAWKLVRLGSVVARSYTTALFPVMTRLYGTSRANFEQLSRDSLRYMFAIALPAAVGVFVLADRAIGLLYTEEYSGSVAVLRVLIWVLLLEFLNPFLSHTLFAKGKQIHSLQVAAIGLVLNTGLSIWLVSHWGAVGAALGTVLGGLVACCCYCVFAFSRADLMALLHVAVRTAAAAAGCGIALVLMRQSHLITLVFVGGMVYVVLMFALRGFTREDYLFLKRNLISSGET